ncbi:LacI family transcriptional regulator [Vallitalea longa]|uniref:LacI family transcriptional regulator n=1 Tax=Vallitalea longa TaxID=2936439 RepID=A0A9W5YE09_9FIRM|nr:LacI family transcriptional regulator [Vallitalea longa]
MSVTIKDVASRANVSPSTVSRVISDNSRISDATKKRVRAAMAELNYQPNLIARSLTNKSTKTLGLLLPGSQEDLLLNPFFVQAMRGISSYAKGKGYYILFTHADNDEDEVEVLTNLVGSQWVDGIILTTVKDNDKSIAFLKEKKHPFVVIGKPDDEEHTYWVDNDNVKAMFQVVDLLIKKGKKNIGFIGGAHEFKVTKHRLLGYLKALKVNNIKADLNLIYEKDYTENAAYEATKELLEYCVPDAIVTTDDLIAFGAQRALIENNMGNISLVGFNNTVLSMYKIPSISSVDINAEKLGMFAAKLLINHIEKQKVDTTNYIIDTKFIERDSTK